MPEPEAVRRRRLDHDRQHRDAYCSYVGTRLSHEQRDALEHAATEADDSISEVVRQAVEAHLRKLERARKRAQAATRKNDK